MVIRIVHAYFFAPCASSSAQTIDRVVAGCELGKLRFETTVWKRKMNNSQFELKNYFISSWMTTMRRDYSVCTWNELMFPAMTDCNRRLMAVDSNAKEWMGNEKTPFIILAE